MCDGIFNGNHVSIEFDDGSHPSSPYYKGEIEEEEEIDWEMEREKQKAWDKFWEDEDRNRLK